MRHQPHPLSGVEQHRHIMNSICTWHTIGRPSLVTLLSLAALLWAAGCSKPTAPDPTVLAKVGKTEIREEDFLRELAWRREHRRPAIDRAELLEEMILQEALLQRARRSGLDADPEVQREINKLLVNALLDRTTVAPRKAVTVTAEEIKVAYESNLETYSRPAKARLALLHLRVSPKASEAKRSEIRARLEEARQRALTEPAPRGRGAAAQGFGPLSVDYSDDQASRYRGGDVGWFDVGQGAVSRWPREVTDVGFALDKDAISQVLEAEGGFYLVMKTDWREAAITPLEQVQAVLRQSILVQKRKDVGMAFRQGVLAETGVTVNKERLAALDLPSSDAALAQNQAAPSGLPDLEKTTGNP